MPGISEIAESVISLLIPDVPPPAPPPVKPPETVKPPQVVSVSMGVQAAKLIFGPKPDYPPLARAARIQGVVHLQAVIGVDGSVRNLRAESGPPLLIKAAIDAVSRWRYQPTLLTGRPVEVTTQIDVNFTLRQ
jgi:protein TonB